MSTAPSTVEYMDKTALLELFKSEVTSLQQAVAMMLGPTAPATQLGRYRTYTVALDKNTVLTWPLLTTECSQKVPHWYRCNLVYPSLTNMWFSVKPSSKPNLTALTIDFLTPTQITAVPNLLLQHAQFKPTRILRVLLWLRRIKGWCNARTEGRQRAANEILRQQHPASKILDFEITLHVLGKKP